MNEDKFVCYGMYKQNEFKCLIKCPFKKECEQATESRKFFKQLERNCENGKNK